MLEKPDFPDTLILDFLLAEYALQAVQFDFLPLGADQNTAVYRLHSSTQAVYFVKLRRGNFEEIAVTLPEYMHAQGIREIIAPLPAQKGKLWGELGAFKVILYPFVEGTNGYEARLSESQWIRFGKALKAIHTLRVPEAIRGQIQRETYPPAARQSVRKILEKIEHGAFEDPIAAQAAAFLQSNASVILDLLMRADSLAAVLQTCSEEFIVCHSDLHAGNLLVDADDNLYIVDWDNPILALKERDLMFVGGAQFGADRTPQEEQALFYGSYGPIQLNPTALAYYRYERILQDIAAFGEQLFFTNEGGADRLQSLRYLKSNFDPNNVIEIAYASDKTRG